MDRILGGLRRNNSQQQRFTRGGQIQLSEESTFVNGSEVTSGLELTKDNYYVAIDLLKERYGKNRSWLMPTTQN